MLQSCIILILACVTLNVYSQELTAENLALLDVSDQEWEDIRNMTKDDICSTNPQNLTVNMDDFIKVYKKLPNIPWSEWLSDASGKKIQDFNHEELQTWIMHYVDYKNAVADYIMSLGNSTLNVEDIGMNSSAFGTLFNEMLDFNEIWTIDQAEDLKTSMIYYEMAAFYEAFFGSNGTARMYLEEEGAQEDANAEGDQSQEQSEEGFLQSQEPAEAPSGGQEIEVFRRIHKVIKTRALYIKHGCPEPMPKEEEAGGGS